MTYKLVCECGLSVTGTTKQHAKANLKLHKIGRLHKDIMKNKKEGVVTG